MNKGMNKWMLSDKQMNLKINVLSVEQINEQMNLLSDEQRNVQMKVQSNEQMKVLFEEQRNVVSYENLLSIWSVLPPRVVLISVV